MKLRLLILFLLLTAFAAAQTSSGYGTITATASTCSVSTTACVILPLSLNSGTAVVTVRGTFTATVQFESSADNESTWTALTGAPQVPGTAVSSATATGVWSFPISGQTHIRVRSSAYTSGTVDVTIQEGRPASVVNLVGGSISASNASVGTNGAAIPTSSSQAGGSDGTNLQPIAVDSSGRQKVIGASATGAAVAGNPVLIGGSDGTNAQAIATSNTGIILLGTVQTPGIDAQASSALPRTGAAAGAPFQVADYAFDGTNWDKKRSAALATFPTSQTSTARNSIGATVTEKGSRFASFSNPAAGSVASLVWASEASVRHVADCITFSASAVVAPVLTSLTINLRDGASGAGTVLMSWQVAIGAATGQSVAPHSICGLSAVGTTATAMTIEFSAALANLSESVSFTGYNVN